jgi:hypothetical protein
VDQKLGLRGRSNGMNILTYCRCFYPVQFSDQCLFSFKNSFLYPRLAEYAVSGHPVQWDTAIEIHNTVDKRWEVRIFVCMHILSYILSYFIFVLYSTGFCVDTARYQQKEDDQQTHIIDVSVRPQAEGSKMREPAGNSTTRLTSHRMRWPPSVVSKWPSDCTVHHLNGRLQMSGCL